MRARPVNVLPPPEPGGQTRRLPRSSKQLRVHPFHQPANGDEVYDNHELISRWNYQLTKALSFNLIGQYISTLPRSNRPDEFKVAFCRRSVHLLASSRTALYLGYIGNFENIDRTLCTREADGLCNPLIRFCRLPIRLLMNDGKTIYVKVSYLLRF